MQRRTFAAAAVLLAALGGCGGGGDSATGPVPLDFTVIDQSLNISGGIQSQRFVTVRSDAEWQALWAEYKGALGLSRPTVAFQTKTVLAVFTGKHDSACAVTAIARVVQDAGAIRVEYTDRVPTGQNTCLPAVSYPAAIVSIARSDLPVTFLKVDQ